MELRGYFRLAVILLSVPVLWTSICFRLSTKKQKEDKPITVEIILDRWADAVGGKDTLRQMRSIYTRAAYQGTAGVGIVEVWQTYKGQHKQSNNLTSGHEVNVFDGSTGWRCFNRRVREYSHDETEGARNGAFMGSYSHLIPGRLPGRVDYLGEDEQRKNHVLRIVPQAGRASKIYLDKSTFLPTRAEEQLTNTMLTVEIKSWRSVSGIKIPAQLHMITSNGYEATETIKEARINLRLDPRFFGKPAEGPKDYRFSSGQSALRIPIEIDDGHIFLRGQINNSQSLWFSLDTAASRSLIDTARAKALRIELFGQPGITGAGGSVTGAYAKNLSVGLSGVRLSNQTFLALPLDPLSTATGRQIDGIFGYDFFHRFVVEIDYSDKYISLYDPQSFDYRRAGEVLPLSLHNDQPYVQAKLVLSGNNQIDGEYVIDTGSGNSLMLAKDFASANGVLASLERSVQSRAVAVGGEIAIAIGRTRAVQLGRFTIGGIITLFPEGEITAPGKAGNIGGKFLRRFRVTFDYSRQRMILEPKEHFADPEEYDMSGMSLRAETTSKVIRISRILKDSPAAEVGLKPNDIILSINGQSAAEIGLSKLREIFKQDGREYQLSIKRGEDTLQISLKLKRLI